MSGKIMKKIGIFSAYYIPHLGGVERYVQKLSASLKKLGYEIVIVTSNHDGLKNREVLDGRTVYRLPIHSFAKNRYPVPKINAEYKNIIRKVKDEQIDYYIVNTRFYPISLIGSRMGKRSGRPVMLIEHGTGHFTVNNRWLDYFGLVYEHVLTFFIKKYVSKFYGVSENCNVWLKHFSIKASGVFHNAIDAADEKETKDYYKDKYPKSELIIAYAGRLIKEKGILNLLDAFSKVKKENPSIKMRLVVAGDGSLLEDIKQDFRDPSIDILGKLDFAHVMALYKRADIYVHPSLYPEGLPTSILEAGLMGCAVIATPRGGTPEVIIDKHHGIIVDGSKESLFKALDLLVTDSACRKALAMNIKQRVEKIFNWETVAKEVDAEIRKF
jgi:glycosyltransferase involved in cell wall biosynthesis